MEWRAIPSLPDYEASSAGTVRRRPFSQAMPNGGTRTYGGTETTGAWDGARFIISYRGKSRKIARLVCEAFHGPANGRVCMHLDEDARNNRPDNLAWGTQKENLNFPGFKAKRARLSSERWHQYGGFSKPAMTAAP